MKTKTSVQAGGLPTQHNARQLRIRTGIKAGVKIGNHNVRSLRVQTGIKAGPIPMDEGRKGGGQ